MVDLTVTNARRLMDTIACLEPELSLAFVLEDRPTFEDIDHLKIEIVLVPPDPLTVPFTGTDHLGMEFAPGRLTNPQISILEECA